MSTRILIADDHDVVRAGLFAILNFEPDMQVVGEARTTEEALILAEKLKPDLILMDISMPEVGGFEATRRIVERQPGSRVLILTIHEDESLVREAIKAGAVGYIPKRALKTELIGAIQSVLRGELYVHPVMLRFLMTELSEPADKSRHAEQTLTDREVEVLRFIAQGFTNSQIAELIHISVRTVEYHRANLMGKLNLTSRVELVRYAADHKII